MGIENKNIVNLDLKNEEKILDFSDFQKQNIKFDIDKLQEAYNQIIQTKKCARKKNGFHSSRII